MNKTMRKVFIVFISYFLMSLGCCFAKEVSYDVMPLALDMFKFDQYLPAIEVLKSDEESQKDVFNYWLYLGLAYQKTEQLNKALSSYQTALKLNPKAGNLNGRIKNLQKQIIEIGKDKVVEFKSDLEKASWLLRQAQILSRNKNEEKALRIFIQAVEYDVNILGDDKGFVRRGTVYFRLKVKEKAEYSRLFYAIFKLFEGNEKEALASIEIFKKDKSNKPLAIQRLEDYYYEKILESVNNQRNIILAEENELKAKKEQLEKSKLASKPNTGKIKILDESTNTGNRKNTRNTKQMTSNSDIQEIESEINNNNFYYDDSIDFVDTFAEELAKEKIKDYYATTDIGLRRKILWEIGQSGSKSPEAMEAIIDGLKQNSIDLISNSVFALKKIGSPSAEAAIPTLYELLDSDNPGFRHSAIDALGTIQTKRIEIINKFLEKYSKEDFPYLKDCYVNTVKSFGDEGLKHLYNVLNETTRLERRPIARFINAITGEKIEELINR